MLFKKKQKQESEFDKKLREQATVKKMADAKSKFTNIVNKMDTQYNNALQKAVNAKKANNLEDLKLAKFEMAQAMKLKSQASKLLSTITLMEIRDQFTAALGGLVDIVNELGATNKSLDGSKKFIELHDGLEKINEQNAKMDAFFELSDNLLNQSMSEGTNGSLSEELDEIIEKQMAKEQEQDQAIDSFFDSNKNQNQY